MKYTKGKVLSDGSFVKDIHFPSDIKRKPKITLILPGAKIEEKQVEWDDVI